MGQVTFCRSQGFSFHFTWPYWRLSSSSCRASLTRTTAIMSFTASLASTASTSFSRSPSRTSLRFSHTVSSTLVFSCYATLRRELFMLIFRLIRPQDKLFIGSRTSSWTTSCCRSSTSTAHAHSKAILCYLRLATTSSSYLALLRCSKTIA